MTAITTTTEGATAAAATSSPPQSSSSSSSSEYWISSIFLIFIVPALGGLLFGYDIGATSFAVVALGAMSPVVTGLFVAAPSAGALLGSIVVFFKAESMGRRQELRVGSLLYIIGAILESQRNAVYIMFLGRLLYGLGIGFSMHGAPTYLGEMLPSSIRGALVSLKEVFIVIGILLGYTSGYFYGETNFAYSYLLSLLGSTVMLVLSFRIPCSARWLVSKGRNQEALKALSFVYRDPNPEYNALLQAHEEQQQLQLQQQQQQQQQESASLEDDDANMTPLVSSDRSSEHNNNNNSIFHPSRRAALRAGIGLVILQQVTGQPSVLSYATPIFQSAGLASFSSVLVALFKLVATSSAVFTVEYYGRKQLLYVGCSLMLLALIVLTFAFDNNKYNQDDGADDTKSDDMTIQTTLILAAMFAYIGGYQIGFGPMSWLIMSEVFPQSIRGQAVAVAVQVNFLLNAIVQFGVPVLESWWGLSNTFGLFAVLTAYSIWFVYRYVLETKGLTLEEIERLFQEGGGRQQSNAPATTMSTALLANADTMDEEEELLPTSEVETTEQQRRRRTSSSIASSSTRQEFV